MIRPSLTAALLLALATPAGAACFADYKAKQDNPLRLQYGVAEVSAEACAIGPAQAEGELAPRLAAGGWTLLQVVSVFGPEGLDERKARAGDNFLRF